MEGLRGGERPPSSDGERSLTGPDKVTALLLTMGKTFADRIIKEFEDQEIRDLARCAASLPAVSEGLVSKLVSELHEQLLRSNDLVGSADEAQNLIGGVVSEDQVAEIMSELNGTASERVWLKLATAADDKLLKFIASEQRQVAAVVLSKLDVEKASSVMEKLSSEHRVDLSRRLLSLKPVREDAMRIVSERLSHELFQASGTTNEMSKHARLGAILTNLNKAQIVEVIGDLERDSPEDAQLVKEYVFTFEDIAGMSAPDRSRLFDDVPSERTIMALRETAAQLRDIVLQALSPRSRRMVEAELATAVNVTPIDIAAAKRSIASHAMGLAQRSVIRLRAESEETGAA